MTEPVSHVGTKNFQARRAVLATGFTQMSAAVLTYVASALAGATSAGFFVAATYGLPLGNAGVIALLAGLILTALSFTLVPLAYSELRKGSEEGTDLKQALRIGRHILGIAYLVLAVAGALILVGGFTRGGFVFVGAGVVMTLPVALAFLTAIAIPAATLAKNVRKNVAIGGAVLVSVASVAELVLGLATIFASRVVGPFWFGLGGYPLLNWSLPFGTLVAIGYLMIWSTYRSLTR